ncbi:hypothetical protein CT688_05235 [Dietzia sp. JS16-p6b]|nr:hypothetical protein CT688_05235 [Dietzia sp. JS16-p6b]QGW24123.1 hypothetical protein GJR88_01689 [Dietzia sp. DQ12-45-1b]
MVASDELTKATRITTDTTGGGAATGTGERGEKVINVDMTVNVNGATDPMAIGDQVVSRITRGLETAIGGQVRSQ